MVGQDLFNEIELNEFIENSSLNEKDKESFLYLIGQIKLGKLDEFTDRSFMFEGDPGIGKTYFLKNFLLKLNLPIFYMGPFEFKNSNVKRFDSLKELLKEVRSDNLSMIFIDDLNNSLKFEYDGLGEMRLIDSERKQFLRLLEILKERKSNMMLFISLNDTDFLEESWSDRIENHIYLEEPSEASKKVFLKERYLDLLKPELVNEISTKSIGYNFRNLELLVKLCYRASNGNITKSIINDTLSKIKPSGLNYEIITNNKLKFSDVIGHDKQKKELLKFKLWLKEYKKLAKHGVKRSNVLIFAGKNGVGKTFMASALAGELDCTLVKADLNIRTASSIDNLISKSKRFTNCVFFIDEADKSFGRPSMNFDESEFLGLMSKKFDSIASKKQGIIIFALNNAFRIGNALKDRFKIIEFEEPTKEDRAEYISRMLKKSVDLRIDINSQDFANMTDGFNYRDLEKLWDDIIFYYFDNGEFNLEILGKLISTYKPTKINSMVG